MKAPGESFCFAPGESFCFAPGESFCFPPVFNSQDLGREIGNVGTYQLSDMDRTQRYVLCVLTIGVQANVACCC